MKISNRAAGNKNSRYVVPIEACRAQESSCAVMVKTAAGLDVAGYVRSERLTLRGDPIDNRALHSLGVVGPSAAGTLLNLLVDTNVSARHVDYSQENIPVPL